MKIKPDFDKVIILYAALVFLLYLLTLSISLDDWDSVQFALGLNEFSVLKHQPHPPGYPIYMLIGKLFFIIFPNEVFALTIMSAFFGSLTVLIFYHFVKGLFNKEIGFFSSLILSITPIFWLNSLKAMTDITALFFTLLTIHFIYKSFLKSNKKHFFISAFLVGISAGVRIHTIVILLPVLIYSLIKTRSKINNGVKLKTISLLIFGLAIWFIPLILITGIPEYFIATEAQYDYRVGRPSISIIGSEIDLFYYLSRFGDFINYFLLTGYAINVYQMDFFDFFTLTIVIIFPLHFIKKQKLRSEKFHFFILLISFYLPMIYIALPPFNARYLLILFPFFSVSMVKTIFKMKKQYRYIIIFSLFSLLLIQSVPLVIELRTIETPPLQLINYINREYTENDYIMLDGGAGRHFSFYETKLQILSYRTDCSEIINKLRSENRLFSLSGNIDCNNVQCYLVKKFSRQKKVHAKHYIENLFECVLEMEQRLE